MNIVCRALLGLLALAALSMPARANLVVDGGFSQIDPTTTAPEGWIAGLGSTPGFEFPTDGLAHFGYTAPAGDGIYLCAAPNTVPCKLSQSALWLDPNVEYAVSIEAAFVPGGDGPVLNNLAVVANGAKVLSVVNGIPGSDFEEFDATFTTGSLITDPTLSVVLSNNPAVTEISALDIERITPLPTEAPEPASFGFFLLAVAGILLLRQRRGRV